jgi:dienelactone hydrolase
MLPSATGERLSVEEYDPFVRGMFSAGVRTVELHDVARARTFPCEIWYPAPVDRAKEDRRYAAIDQVLLNEMRDAEACAGVYPLIGFSHSSGGDRRQSSFLCAHIASHGYVVGALDHSELVAPELARRPQETAEQAAVRLQAMIENRVPDVRFLLDQMLASDSLGPGVDIDHQRIGLIGHSFGGWTVLAAPDSELRVKAVVALTPGGASQRKRNILPLSLNFDWRRNVAMLLLAAEDDAFLPLQGMLEIFERAPSPKLMVTLKRADHLLFMDNAEEVHEAFRTSNLGDQYAEIQHDVKPAAQLVSGTTAHAFARGLSVAHFDGILRCFPAAHRFLEVDLKRELSDRSIDARIETCPAGSIHPRLG